MERLGRYQLVRKLAEGGMAEVYLAKAEGPGGFAKTLVVKRILPALAENPEFVDMFLGEARVAAHFDHPNIVQIFDFGQAGDTYFIAMEFLDGPNLRQLLRWSMRTEPLPWGLLARIVATACDGLGYAHEFVNPETGKHLAIVHRDVSTENVVVTRAGTVKLLDFGVARVDEGERTTKAGGLKGKISYMPPEQLQGGDFDLRVDVYALGVVMYQLATGRKPYGAKEEVGLIAAILGEDPPPATDFRPDLPPELAAVIARAMRRDRDQRYPSCRAMQADLEQFLAKAGEPTGAVQLAQLVSRYHAGSGTVGPDGASGKSGSHSLGSLASGGHTGARRFPTAPPPPPPDAQVDLPAPAKLALEQASLWSAEYEAAELAPTAVRGPLRAPGFVPSSSPFAPSAAPAVQAPAPASAPVATARAIPWTPGPFAPEPIRVGLRGTVVADRTLKVLRKFLGVAERLIDATRGEVPWPLYESFAGALDAAFMADDHSMILRAVERATSHGGRSAQLLMAELVSPLRLVWLVERLRAGAPTDPGPLRGWIAELGAAQLPRLMWAIDALEPGPGQDVLCKAIAPLIVEDPRPVIARITAENPHHLAGYCLALEKSQIRERTKVFQQVLQRHDPAKHMQVLTGRARAGGAESVNLLVGALSDRSEAVRRHVLKLLAEVGDHRVVNALGAQALGPAAEALSSAERAAMWTAIAAAGHEASLPLFEQVLGAKAPLLNRKKAVDAKLAAVDGLAEAKTEEARALLLRVADDRTQPDEVCAAARARLERLDAASDAAAADAPPAGERRPSLDRAITLQLLFFARASSALDLRSDLLDGAVQRLREDLRRAVHQEKRLRLLVHEASVTLNGVNVHYGLPDAEALGPDVARQLAGRDLRGLGLEEPPSFKDVRSLLLWLFDPEGASERIPPGRVLTVLSRAPAPPSRPPPSDPAERCRELYRQTVAALRRERDGLAAGRPPQIASLGPLVQEWADLFAGGHARLLGVTVPPTAEGACAVHATNTALTALAFGADLGLGRTDLQELAELALFYVFQETLLPAGTQLPATHPLPEAMRMRAAGLFLTQLRDRRGTCYAVSALEASADPSPAASVQGAIVNLAETWDALCTEPGATPAKALRTLLSPLRRRFHPELLRLFEQWASRQFGLRP